MLARSVKSLLVAVFSVSMLFSSNVLMAQHEEGQPKTEVVKGGAPLMIKEGAMDNPKIDVMFGLHMASGLPVGQLS